MVLKIVDLYFTGYSLRRRTNALYHCTSGHHKNTAGLETAGHFGIAPDRSVGYLADSEGTKLNYNVMAQTVATFRETGIVGEACFEEIRKGVKRRTGRK